MDQLDQQYQQDQHSIGPADPAELRRVAAAMPSGVALLTAATVPGGYGTTVGTFTLASLDPPLATVYLQEGCRTLQLVPPRAPFGISVLAADQAGIARRFPRRNRTGGLEGLALWAGVQPGVVTLACAAAGFECRAIDHVRIGDHYLLLAHITGAWRRDAIPLIHHNGELVPARSPVTNLPDLPGARTSGAGRTRNGRHPALSHPVVA